VPLNLSRYPLAPIHETEFQNCGTVHDWRAITLAGKLPKPAAGQPFDPAENRVGLR